MSAKPYAIWADDKNLVSKCAGIIRDILESRRPPSKHTKSWDDTFELFLMRVQVDPKLWKRNPSGEIKWKQALYNIAKPHLNKKSPDIMTTGELIALEQEGGFSLPDHMPPGRTAVVFPNKKGFDIKAEKVARKKAGRRTSLRTTGPGHRQVTKPTAAAQNEIDKMVSGLRRVVSNIRDSLRDAVTLEIYNQIHEGKWTFDNIGE